MTQNPPIPQKEVKIAIVALQSHIPEKPLAAKKGWPLRSSVGCDQGLDEP
jgi:hypothetical protein